MSRGNESSDRQVDDLKPPPWRCAVHHLQVPAGDCPKCDDELIALTEQTAAEPATPAMRPRDLLLGVVAELESPRNDRPGRQRRREWAKRIRRALDALEAEHETERQAEEDRANQNATLVHELRRQIEALVAKANAGADAWGACSHEWARIADLEALMTWNVDGGQTSAKTGPVDWDSPTWGGGRHEAAWAPDGTHDDVTEEE